MDRRDNNPRNSSGGNRPPRRPPMGRGYPRPRGHRDERGGSPYGGAAASSRLPEVYYRRRRVAAVGVIIVVALLIAGLLSWFSRGSETTTTGANGTLVVSASTSATTQPTSTAASSETSASTAASTEQSTQPSEPVQNERATEVSELPNPGSQPDIDLSAQTSCEVSDLQVEASADHPSYLNGDLPNFYMKVRNPTGADCTVDLSQDVMRFEVYALDSNQRVWSDIDCNEPVGTGTQTFGAGEERYFKAQWSRTGSSPNSCVDRQPVASGSYYLHTVIGNNPSAPFDFNLQ